MPIKAGIGLSFKRQLVASFLLINIRVHGIANRQDSSLLMQGLMIHQIWSDPNAYLIRPSVLLPVMTSEVK